MMEAQPDMEWINLMDLGPPYSRAIRHLSGESGGPNECGTESEVDGDNDASCFVPLLDEFLRRRESAISQEPAGTPRPAPPVELGQGARSLRCRSIHGLFFEGGEEISLDYLGPNYLNGYDTEPDSVDSTDDCSDNGSQAERSIIQNGQLELESGNCQTRITPAPPRELAQRIDPGAGVESGNNGGDGTPSTAAESQLAAGFRKRYPCQQSFPDACSPETISSDTGTAPECIVFVADNVHGNVPRVCSAMSSLFPKNSDTLVPTDVREPGASLYEFECELMSGDKSGAAPDPGQTNSGDEETRNAKLGRGICERESTAQPSESVFVRGYPSYDDGRKRGGVPSAGAILPASLKAGYNLNDVSENEVGQFNEACTTGATLPGIRASTFEPSGSYSHGTCTSSLMIRDIVPAPSGECVSAYSASLIDSTLIEVRESSPEYSRSCFDVASATVISSPQDHDSEPSKNYFYGAPATSSSSPENRDSHLKPPLNDIDGLCITVSSSPRLSDGSFERDSSLELPHELELKTTDHELANEAVIENATEGTKILDDRPEKSEGLKSAIAAGNCCQTSLSYAPVPLVIASNLEETGGTITSVSVSICKTPPKDSLCSLENTGDRGGSDSAEGAFALLSGVHHGYNEELDETDLNLSTSQLEFQPAIDEVSKGAKPIEHGFRVTEFSDAVNRRQDRSRELPQKSPHIQAGTSHHNGKRNYTDNCRTDMASPASSRPAENSAMCLKSEPERYSGSSCTVDSSPSTCNRDTRPISRVDSNCASKLSEREAEIEGAGEEHPVEGRAPHGYDTLRHAIQHQNVSSPKHNLESSPDAREQLRTGASNDAVLQDTMRAACGETEPSEVCMAQNAMSSASAVSLPGNCESCTETVLEAYSNFSANQTGFDRQTKEQDEVVHIREDTSEGDDTLDNDASNQTVLSADPESLLVARTQPRSGISEDDVLHCTIPVSIGNSGYSEDGSICQADLCSSLPSLCSEALDNSLRIIRGVDLNLPTDQPIGETSEVHTTGDRSQGNDALSATDQNRNMPSPKGSLESFLPRTRTPSDVIEDSGANYNLPVVGGRIDKSEANSACESEFSSHLSLLSEAGNSHTEVFRGVGSPSSAYRAKREQEIRQTYEVVFFTGCASCDGDTLSTAVRNQSTLSDQYNVAGGRVVRDVSEVVSHGTTLAMTNDAKLIRANSIRESGSPTAMPSLLDVDFDISADQFIENMNNTLVKDSSHDNEAFKSAVRNESLERNTEPPPVACAQTQPQVAENDVSPDTIPARPAGVECRGDKSIRGNYVSALPSLSVVDARLSVAQWVEETAKVAVTENTSHDQGTRILNTEALLVPCAQAQPGVTENNAVHGVTPVSANDAEWIESMSTSDNNLRSDLHSIESLRAALQLRDGSVPESLLLGIVLKSTLQYSDDGPSPSCSTPKPAIQLPANVLEFIKTLPCLPIDEFCPPSHSPTVLSHISPPPSLASLSDGEIRSISESFATLPSRTLDEEAASEGGYVRHQYEPDTFVPLSPLSVPTRSEGETADSVSDHSTESAPLSSPTRALNEAVKSDSEDSETASYSATRYTKGRGATSSCSSCSTCSSSSSSSTSDSKDDSENSSSSCPESSPGKEIQEAKTAKVDTDRLKKTIDAGDTAAVLRSEPRYAQLSASGTNLRDRSVNSENGCLPTLTSVSILREHKKDGIEDDAGIVIPLLKTNFGAEDVAAVMHSEPRPIEPARSGVDRSYPHGNQDNDCPAFPTAASALKKDDKYRFQYDADLIIPLEFLPFATKPSERGAVESVYGRIASPSASHSARSAVSTGNKSDFEHGSLTSLRLSPCPERLSSDDKAPEVQGELPQLRKKRKKRARKRQPKSAAHPYRPFQGMKMNTANFGKRAQPWRRRPKPYAPFVTDDPAENWDNEDPEWETVRLLSCDEERYEVVHRVWLSTRIPDPQKDLTAFYHRRRILGIGRWALPSSRSRRKRRASSRFERDWDDAKRRRLDTDIYDMKIEAVKKSRDRALAKANEMLNKCLRELRKERKRSEGRDDSASSSPGSPTRDRSRSYSPERRSRRLRSWLASAREYSPRRVRRRSCSPERKADSSSGNSRRRRRHPSKDTHDCLYVKQRGGCSHPSRDGSCSPSPAEDRRRRTSTEPRKKPRRRHSSAEGTTCSTCSDRSVNRGNRTRRHSSEDSRPPRRGRRGRRASSESNYASSARRRNLSPTDRSKDGTRDSPYWTLRERRIQEDFEADRRQINRMYYETVDKLEAAKHEMSSVNDFYIGLGRTDPRTLSARQVDEYMKVEAMAGQMLSLYNNARD